MRDPIEDVTGDPYGYADGNPITNTDPTGLWAWPSASDIAETSAGIGDALSFGLLKGVRNSLGGGVNECSDNYRVGGYGGTALGIGLGGFAGAGRGAAAGAAGAAGRGGAEGAAAGASGLGRPLSFGHGARHLPTGISQNAAETAIGAAVQQGTAGASATGSFWGRVTVNGQQLEYRAFTRPDGTINIGTYYPIG